jgi:hypothetical protein
MLRAAFGLMESALRSQGEWRSAVRAAHEAIAAWQASSAATRAAIEARWRDHAGEPDYRVAARHAMPPPPDTEPSIYDEAVDDALLAARAAYAAGDPRPDPNDDERSELDPGRR